MNGRPIRDLGSPESIASALVGLLAVVLIATQALASMGVPTSTVESPGPSVAPSAAPTMNPEIRRALATALLVNQSLASRAAALDSAITVEAPLAPEIADHLRSVNADLTAGKEAADRLQLGDDTADLGADLGAFYAGVMTESTETLRNSIRNVAAYIEGGRVVIELLAPLSVLQRPDHRRARWAFRCHAQPESVGRESVGSALHTTAIAAAAAHADRSAGGLRAAVRRPGEPCLQPGLRRRCQRLAGPAD